MIDPLTLSFFIFLPFPRDLGVAAVGWHGPARRRGSDGKAPRGGEGCGGEGAAARDDAGIFFGTVSYGNQSLGGNFGNSNKSHWISIRGQRRDL